MSGKGLRSRYAISFLLILLPILVFSMIIYVSSSEQMRQSIDSLSLQNFTYASESISTVIDRLHNAAEMAFSLESEIHVENGNVSIEGETKFCAALSALESRIYPSVKVLFYIKGDKNIYSADGKQNYGEYERTHMPDYNLTNSIVFTKLQTVEESTLIPLISSKDNAHLSGLAYALPYPIATNTKGVLIFVLSDDMLFDEFANYMGDFVGSLYLYNSRYSILYEIPGLQPHPSADQVLRLRGTGVIPVEIDGESLVMLRVVDSEHDMNWLFLSSDKDFYQAMFSTQRLLLALVSLLILLLLCILVGVAFFQYEPIRELFSHVTGSTPAQSVYPPPRNEIELIRTYYDRVADEVNALSTQLNAMIPLVARRFIRQLVFGYIADKAEFERLAAHSGLDFSAPFNVSMYLVFPHDDEDRMERAATILPCLPLQNTSLGLIELYSENALCVTLNFAAQDGNCGERVELYARRFYDYLTENGAPPVAIGIGSIYEDPLKLNESFAEANIAIQLAPSGSSIARYSGANAQLLADESGGLHHGLSSISLSLLKEGINRGDRATALSALNDLLNQLSESSHPIAFYRFHCSELLAFLLRAASDLSLPVNTPRIQQLVSFTSQKKFSQEIVELVDEMCGEMKQRLDSKEQQLKQDILDYMLKNFKRNDLSIQTVSDETGFRRAQITALINEETGLGFVQYVSYLRINEFKRLLLQSDQTIRELVLQVGYTDVPNFLRKFKQLEGMTPSQYRSQMQA